MKRHIIIGWFACMLGLSRTAHSQAVPTATSSGAMQIGVGWSITDPDYGRKNANGPTIYGTFDFTRHIGIEGDIHLTSYFTPSDIGQKSYLLGPRYVFHFRRFHPYIKGLLGLGTIEYQFDNRPHSSDTTLAYALGGGLDIKATRKINVRVFDIERQKWPRFLPNGLTPIVTTFGVAYTFH